MPGSNLPWFIVDEILQNLELEQLPKLRLLNKLFNQTALRKIFRQIDFINCPSFPNNRNILAQYGSLCQCLILLGELGFYLDSTHCRLELFSHFPQVHSIRFYISEGLDITYLKSISYNMPKLRHMSIYYLCYEPDLGQLSSLTMLTSLTVCFESQDLFEQIHISADFPNVKKLVVIKRFYDFVDFTQVVYQKFPSLVYFHALTRLEDTDFSIFEADLVKMMVLRIGKVFHKLRVFQSFKLNIPLMFNPASQPGSDPLTALYKQSRLKLEGFLVGPPFAKEVRCYHSAAKDNLLEFPQAASVLIHTFNLSTISILSIRYSTTTVTIRGFHEIDPSLLQKLIDHFPNLKCLDISCSLHAFNWDGTFPSLETLKTSNIAFSGLSKFLKAAPNLKCIHSNLQDNTKAQLLAEYPGILLAPYPVNYYSFKQND
ncbi:hypothetical protein DSO57_1039575 [Entomophthora muscae]|uniref:Uncharacterized protein n=2 Tax=Entomophthora muscae TaxID=34485 RepID=A0ACC2U7Z6_9FUNG|nr:hypothetical protein DSO57_1039575 [Entomophthora muscae]